MLSTTIHCKLTLSTITQELSERNITTYWKTSKELLVELSSLSHTNWKEREVILAAEQQTSQNNQTRRSHKSKVSSPLVSHNLLGSLKQLL